VFSRAFARDCLAFQTGSSGGQGGTLHRRQREVGRGGCALRNWCLARRSWRLEGSFASSTRACIDSRSRGFVLDSCNRVLAF
jgi:hypothetical protein